MPNYLYSSASSLASLSYFRCWACCLWHRKSCRVWAFCSARLRSLWMTFLSSRRSVCSCLPSLLSSCTFHSVSTTSCSALWIPRWLPASKCSSEIYRTLRCIKQTLPFRLSCSSFSSSSWTSWSSTCTQRLSLERTTSCKRGNFSWANQWPGYWRGRLQKIGKIGRMYSVAIALSKKETKMLTGYRVPVKCNLMIKMMEEISKDFVRDCGKTCLKYLKRKRLPRISFRRSSLLPL